MDYRSPVADIMFSLRFVAGFDKGATEGLFGALDRETAAAVVEEAGRFATRAIAPLDRVGDVEGARWNNGVVTMPTGFADVFREWARAGWGGVTGAAEYGGMGLPHTIGAACTELWAGASLSFSLCPLLNEGAINALNAFGGEHLRRLYLGKLITGEWTGTMNLTEPQAGSDLSAVKTRAERAGNGIYRVTGQKIFITYGEHNMTDNIVHLVLARLPDAAPGTRGLSLFLVPKFLANDDGSLGARNDVRCARIEHKLGIHASPTCEMIYGDEGGATGWLVGEEGRGLAAMFVMMNSARLSVGMQGVAVADRALQRASAFARERRQGRAANSEANTMAPIVEHPDVQRMLLTMKSLVHAARGICHLTAVAIDGSLHARSAAERARASERAALLTPVAKAFSSEVGDEAASMGVQVHGGMGYIEETGAAQDMRDARIAAIYEGANGVQAIDLVQRKLPLSGGAAVASEIAWMRGIAREIAACGEQFGATGQTLARAIDALERATHTMLEALERRPVDALAGAAPYLRLFALTLGAACLAKAGLAAQALDRGGDPSQLGRVALARFFAEKILPASSGLEEAIGYGAGALEAWRAAMAG